MQGVQHITGGSLFIFGGNAAGFGLETHDFAIQFRLGDIGSFPIALMVSAGDTINLSALLAGDQTLNVGVADVGGQVYPQLFFTGVLQFHALPIVVPADSGLPVHRTTHFTLDGNLQAYHNNPFIGPPGPPVFDVALSGGGRTTVRFGPTVAGTRSVTSYFLSFH